MNRVIDTIYIFGAGASALSLPIVAQIADSTEAISLDHKVDVLRSAFQLRTVWVDYFQTERVTKSETFIDIGVYKKVLNNLNLLCETLEENPDNSVDVIYKILITTGKKSKAEAFLNSFNLYFNILEYIKPLDPRYKTFLAHLAEQNGDLPNNMAVVSWNYDRQLYNAYVLVFGSSQDRYRLSVIDDYCIDETKTHFPIFTINGTFAPKNLRPLINKKDSIRSALSILHKELMANTQLLDVSSDIKFYWNSDKKLTTSDNLIDIIKNANNIVFIGYSFPQYNKDFDNLIFDSIHPKTQVYIQSPNAENLIQDIKHRFGVSNSKLKQLIPYKNIDEFLIPPNHPRNYGKYTVV